VRIGLGELEITVEERRIQMEKTDATRVFAKAMVREVPTASLVHLFRKPMEGLGSGGICGYGCGSGCGLVCGYSCMLPIDIYGHLELTLDQLASLKGKQDELRKAVVEEIEIKAKEIARPVR
jgi:hypothetical protein